MGDDTDMQPHTDSAGMDPTGSILGFSTSSTGWTYTLGACTVELVGPSAVYPVQPNEDVPANNWPTVVMAMFTPILMTNGVTWYVSRPPTVQPDGRIQIQFKAPVGRNTVTFYVPADCTEETIWNVGFPFPEPEPPVEPTPVPSPEPNPTDPGQPPVETPEIPVEPTEPPVDGGGGGGVEPDPDPVVP